MQYAIIIEGAEGNYAAYAPDVPGCGAAGDTIEEVTELIREALALHFEELAAHDEPVPAPVSRVAVVDVAMPHGVIPQPLVADAAD